MISPKDRNADFLTQQGELSYAPLESALSSQPRPSSLAGFLAPVHVPIQSDFILALTTPYTAPFLASIQVCWH